MAGRSGGMEEQCSVCIVVSKRYSYVECFCGRDSTALGWRLAITLDFGSMSVNGRIFLDAPPSSFVSSSAGTVKGNRLIPRAFFKIISPPGLWSGRAWTRDMT